VRTTLKRAWHWIAVLWLILCLYPVEYRTSRIVEIAGAAVVWTGALLLWWKVRHVRIGLVLLAVVVAIPLSLPRRAVDREGLAADYCRGLRSYRGVRDI